MTHLLRATRDWLTVSEAAAELSEHGDRITAADVLRLALDGHLRLSLRLPPNTRARIYKNRFPYSFDKVTESTTIEGLWHLPIRDAARRQIEHDLNASLGLSNFTMDGTAGVEVERGGGTERCQLSPDPGDSGSFPRLPSALPNGANIVVRRADLEPLLHRLKPDVGRQATSHEPDGVPANAEKSNESLGTRERRTLHLIICALAKEAKVDITKASKAGETIATLVSALGFEIAPNTAARHIREARIAVQGEDRSS